MVNIVLKKEDKNKAKCLIFLYNKMNNKKDTISYIIILLVVLIIKFYVVTPVRVNGESMYSTLRDKEIMILNELYYRFHDIKRFDIVVLKYNKSKLIKRVIGLPGETIRYEDEKLYINDEVVEENFTHKYTKDFDITKFGDKVPEDSYFVMGDNRGNSLDSRSFGFVKKKAILGRAKIVIFPFKAIRTVK